MTGLTYAAVAAPGALLTLGANEPGLRATGLGLIAPGAGFLVWAGPGGDGAIAIALAAGSCLIFVAALAIWFATGNVLLPPIAWGVAVAGAATGGFGLLDPAEQAAWPHAPDIVLLAVAALTAGMLFAASRRRRTKPALADWSAPASSRPDASGELGCEDLERIRLLLDRALQPVGEFEGFEWRDQFQTAAVRYQLNFASYALSAVQAACLPAMQGWLLEAQRRLLAKQSDSRIWRYWQLENLWGNLRRETDPVPRDNIMYSGFIAAQVALADQASGGRLLAGEPALDLATGDGRRFIYRQDELVTCLASQYARAPFGLLACEPNWIYPLCNAITATALRAHDAQQGTAHWERTAVRFRDGLEREFTRADGRLVPFRSSLTGFAPPVLGGAVMQAFPCYFLNALFPDLAAAHWGRFRDDLAKRPWRRAFWPVDVGNYGFSYASSLAASAAAATEMGDDETAAQLLDWLDEACPAVSSHGVRHRRRASLWAHALEIIARHGGPGGLRSLASAEASTDGPFVEHAHYPDVLVTAASARGRSLRLTLHPGDAAGRFEIGIGGLMPDRHYRLDGCCGEMWRADRVGRLRLPVVLTGRTDVHLVPVV